MFPLFLHDANILKIRLLKIHTFALVVHDLIP